jgi:thymidylate synthase
MNNIDKQYQLLLQDILDNGVKKETRNGGTISVFGRQIRHKMSEGFPLLTTKKMAWKTIVTELLWFLRGDTNIKYLVDNNCHIWNGDAYQAYIKRYNKGEYVGKTKLLENSKKNRTLTEPFTIEEFIDKIKTDDEFAKKWGELGPIYGKQWRSWETEDEYLDGVSYFKYPPIDQIQNLINDLKTNPDSRRLMVSAWNVGELDKMTLPPCHYGFQVYTRELSLNDRVLEFTKRDLDPSEFRRGGNYGTVIPEERTLEVLNNHNIPTRAISLMWNQRSVDTFLGLPFNIASYGLLLEIIAKTVNMVPDELIGNLGDVHLYSNHIEQAKEQIGRKYTHEERTELLKTAMGDFYKTAVDEQVPFGGGLSEYYNSYKIPNHTREPFKLPTLKINSGNENWHLLTVDEVINTLDVDITFKTDNYQSHSTIKAPLSN